MRLALLHPTYWPEVRRGSERLAHDLGAALAARGHDVTLITSHAGRRAESSEDGIRVVRGRRVPRLPGMDWYDPYVGAVPSTLRELQRGGFELAHALYPVDAWAASLAQRLGGPPYVFSVHGIVNREYLVRRRYRLEQFKSGADGARAVSALSEAAAEPLRRYALADPVILPGGVNAADYAGEVVRPERPTLLCPAALGDPRKRGELLLEAFVKLRRSVPNARLVLAGGRDPFSGSGPDRLPDGVETAELDGTADLAEAYRTATATVLPSIDEAFGLVLVESLAAGTPVIAARSGGCTEIVTDERIGASFEPDDADELTGAMAAALELGSDPETAGACRAHAESWDWAWVVERYEAVYAEALGKA